MKDYKDSIAFKECEFTFPGQEQYTHLVLQELPIENTGIPGFPETRQVVFTPIPEGFNSFQPSHIEVDSDHFEITSCIVGPRSQWDSRIPVTATMLATRPVIAFTRVSAAENMAVRVKVREGVELPVKFTGRVYGTFSQSKSRTKTSIKKSVKK